MLGKFLRVSLMGMALGAVGGAFAPVQSASAVRECKCTEHLTGAFSCASPTANWCAPGFRVCYIVCEA